MDGVRVAKTKSVATNIDIVRLVVGYHKYSGGTQEGT